MANITLAIPDDLHRKLRKHKEVRWSEIIRQILDRKLENLEMMERIVSKSKLTQEDADEISAKIKKGIARRHGLD